MPQYLRTLRLEEVFAEHRRRNGLGTPVIGARQEWSFFAMAYIEIPGGLLGKVLLAVPLNCAHQFVAQSIRRPRRSRVAFACRFPAANPSSRSVGRTMISPFSGKRTSASFLSRFCGSSRSGRINTFYAEHRHSWGCSCSAPRCCSGDCIIS